MSQFNNTNVFYCSGLTGLIVASMLLLKLHKNDKNILILEQVSTISISSGNITSTPAGYNDLLDFCTKLIPWDSMYYLPVKSFYFQRQSFNFFGINAAIPGFRLVINRVSLFFSRAKLRRMVKGRKINNSYISDNSIYGSMILKSSKNKYLFEHGAASYKANPTSSFFMSLKDHILIGVNRRSIYKSIAKKIVSIDMIDSGSVCISDAFLLEELTTVFKVFASSFKNNLLQNFVSSKIEIYNIKKLFKVYKYVFIYHPTALINNEDYFDYLNTQMTELKKYVDDSFLVILKPHSNDQSRDYSPYFTDLGIETYKISDEILRIVPMELILFIFPKLHLIGAYSTSHLYSKAWLSRRSFFLEVVDHPLNKYLECEYIGVVEKLRSLSSNNYQKISKL